MLALNIQDQLNQFSELMEEIENQSKRRIVSKKEINELSIYIGGFKYWKFLNEDCKIEVLKYLDYCSRCQLSICSKSDHKLVSITPLYVYEIEISDNERSLHSTSTKDFVSFVILENEKNCMKTSRLLVVAATLFCYYGDFRTEKIIYFQTC